MGREVNKKKVKTKITPPKNGGKQLSRDEIRSINKKRIRRKRKLKRLAVLSLLSTVVIGVCLALMLTVFFKIETVVVKGERVYSDSQIIEKSGIEIGKNLFSVSEDKLNDNLTKSLPYIKKVTVKRELPDKLIITVYAAKEIAALENGAVFTLIDETGKVLDTDSSILKENVAVVSGVKLKKAEEGENLQLKDEGLNEVFLSALKSIKKSEFKLLTEIIVDKNNEFQLIYDDRIKVVLGSTVNIDKKIARAKAAIEKENEINPYAEGTLDLRTEPYVYFRAGKQEDDTKPSVTNNSAQRNTDNNSENSTTLQS